MTRENLIQKIDTILQEDEFNLEEAAATLGKQALVPLKKIIDLNDTRAQKAIQLQKKIETTVGQKKPGRRNFGQFSLGMRSISSNTPDEHIHGFGSDMRTGRSRK